MMTLAPCRASASAVALPMPSVAPVTRKVGVVMDLMLLNSQ